eukprot:GEZU01036277.1.p2 GENE.GEZU01036277.1~~GEZU01036277.1.p2  ORF type:complete len:101 (+),score=15.86 GEZU01036277.1:132-434(+)
MDRAAMIGAWCSQRGSRSFFLLGRGNLVVGSRLLINTNALAVDAIAVGGCIAAAVAAAAVPAVAFDGALEVGKILLEQKERRKVQLEHGRGYRSSSSWWW